MADRRHVQAHASRPPLDFSFQAENHWWMWGSSGGEGVFGPLAPGVVEPRPILRGLGDHREFEVDGNDSVQQGTKQRLVDALFRARIQGLQQDETREP